MLEKLPQRRDLGRGVYILVHACMLVPDLFGLHATGRPMPQCPGFCVCISLTAELRLQWGQKTSHLSARHPNPGNLTKSGVQVFTTVHPGQSNVALMLYQGESQVASRNKQLGQFHLVGLPQAPVGVPQIEVSHIQTALLLFGS